MMRAEAGGGSRPHVNIVSAPPWVSVGEEFEVVAQGTSGGGSGELKYRWTAKLGEKTDVDVFQSGPMVKIVAPELSPNALNDVLMVEVVVEEDGLASGPAGVEVLLYRARLVFSQVGVGWIDENRRLETSVVLVNPLEEYVCGKLRFTSGQEDPKEWHVLVDGIQASESEFLLEPFGSREFVLTGDEVRAGWMELVASGQLAGHLFYRVRSLPLGRLFFEVGSAFVGMRDDGLVLLEVPILPFKGRAFMTSLAAGENANIALALVNVSEEPCYFQVVVNEQHGGASLRTEEIRLERDGHMAMFLEEVLSKYALSMLSPAFKGGTLVVETTGGDRALLGVTILKTTADGLPFSMLPVAVTQ